MYIIEEGFTEVWSTQHQIDKYNSCASFEVECIYISYLYRTCSHNQVHEARHSHGMSMVCRYADSLGKVNMHTINWILRYLNGMVEIISSFEGVAQ